LFSGLVPTFSVLLPPGSVSLFLILSDTLLTTTSEIGTTVLSDLSKSLENILAKDVVSCPIVEELKTNSLLIQPATVRLGACSSVCFGLLGSITDAGSKLLPSKME